MEADNVTISTDWARQRLSRLRSLMAAIEVPVVVLNEPYAVHHSMGATSAHGWPSAVVVTESTAHAVFFALAELDISGDDQVVLRGIRTDCSVDHASEMAAAVRPLLSRALAGSPSNRVGLELETAPFWLMTLLQAQRTPPQLVNVAVDLADLRRAKDPDELSVIRRNVAICEAAYSAAQEAIAPGVTELEVFGAIRDAAEAVGGTSVPLGGDFASGPGGGERGGPPTRRTLKSGDSFVIDIWPSLGGYWADMARTFVVGKASSEQRMAVELTNQAVEIGESLIVPGVKAADVDRVMRGFLEEHRSLGGGSYFNLSGHGLGLAPHEAPWILSESEDAIEVGDVITMEPGLYASSLRGGVRTEDNYVVHEDHLENLCSFPRFLV